ncbi:hypothetical protein [Shumkonia mesophila]|uniref:hypothetical protein n=1 Tax=Shumkonia mesophila TaxID=2838854 RepID=UPI002934B37C|nr:hypothetical protein [Shumkonia mesophila]
MSRLVVAVPEGAAKDAFERAQRHVRPVAGLGAGGVEAGGGIAAEAFLAMDQAVGALGHGDISSRVGIEKKGF